VAIHAADGGRRVFRIRVEARKVTLFGSMTRWRPRPLQRLDGAFEIGLDLRPGRYEYRFEVEDAAGVRTLLPDEGERTPDGFGGENAVLRVQ
jgi:hypothetical protein